MKTHSGVRYLGRRIVISFGKHTIALEKLVRQDPSDVGLASGPQEGGTFVKVYEIVEHDGERVERLLGPAVVQRYGLDVNSYFTDPCYWTVEGDPA